MTAAPEVRAMRRYRELRDKGHDVEYGALLQEVLQRDKNDSERAAAPLRQAPDAWLCDTTALDFDESVETILRYIKEHISL